MNPIKTSDLFQNTGEITKLREELALMVVELEKLEKAQGKLTAAQQKEIATAKALSDQMEKLNSSTSENREEIEESAKQTEEIDKRLDKYHDTLNEVAKSIEKNKQAQQLLNTVNKLNVKIATEQEGSYNKLSAQYGLIKVRLNQMSRAQRENTDEGRKLVKQSKEIYDEMKRLQEQTGKNVLSVGDYARALENLGGPIAGIVRDLRMFRDGMVAQVNSMRASVSGLSGMSKALQLFKLALISTGIGAFVVILGSLVAFLAKTQKGVDFVEKTMAKLGAAVRVVIDRMSTFGEGMAEILTGNFDEGWKKMKESAKGFGEELKTEVKRAGELTTALQELEDAEIAFSITKSAVSKKISELERQAAEARGKDAKRAAELTQQAIDATDALLEQETNIAKRRRDILTEQINMGKASDEQMQEVADAIAKVNDLETAANERKTGFLRKLNSLNKAAGKEDKEQIKFLEEKQKAQEKFLEEKQKAQDDYNKSVLEGAKLFRTELDNNITKIEEELKTLEAINIEFGIDVSGRKEQLAQELIKLGEEAFGIATKPLTDIAQASMDQVLRGQVVAALKVRGDLDQSAVGFFKKIQEGIDGLGLDEGSDIFDLFGLDGDQTEALRQSYGIITDFLSQITDAQLEAANKQVEIENNKVSQLQRNLQIEMQARAEGYASNVSGAQTALAAAQKAQKQALKDQAEAQKQQQKLQTVQQSVDLVSGAAKIFGQFPIYLAIPLVALMFGTFIAAKVQAAKLSKQEFKEGGLEIIGGGTHASGNDTALGFESNGKPAYAEVGEAHAIIPASKTRKYKKVLPDLVDSLRKGTFEKKYQKINASQTSDYNIIVSNESGSNVDLARVENDLAAIRRNGERLTVFDSTGKVKYEKTGNTTRVYV